MLLKNNMYHQKIADKRAELENLQEFRKLSSTLADQLEEVERKLSTMNDGAESISLVLSNWQNVVKSVSLASLGLMKYTKKDYEEQTPLPEPLVRIKLDKDDIEEPYASQEKNIERDTGYPLE